MTEGKKSKTRQSKTKQSPPVAFRPPPDLDRLVGNFCAARGRPVNETYKDLAALAVVGLDARYLDSIDQFAGCLAGPHAFVRAVLDLHSALTAVAAVDVNCRREPERTNRFISTLNERLTSLGQVYREEIFHALLVSLGLRGDDDETQESECKTEAKTKVPIRINQV